MDELFGASFAQSICSTQMIFLVWKLSLMFLIDDEINEYINKCISNLVKTLCIYHGR